MSGAVWAALSGGAFGLFQALNARAVRGLGSAYVSTFLQLAVAALILVAIAAATEDLGRVGRAPTWSIVAFTLGGVVHFFVGWTALNFSQARIGAARTSPMLATTPVFGLVFAAVFAGELPRGVAFAGVALTIVGAYLVSDPGGGHRARLRDSGFALTTAAAWSLSPLFTVKGLDGLDSPLIGVVIGMLAASLCFGVLLLVGNVPLRGSIGSREALGLKLAAGVIIAIATWWRWISLDDTDVAVVLSLALVSVPTVLLIAPLVSGRHVEIVTPRIWAGAALVLAGALLLIVIG